MKRWIIVCPVLFITMVMGCSTSADNVDMTEEKAIDMVKEEHAREEGAVEIISVLDRDGKYLIHWEIDPIMEGMDSVDQTTGKLKQVESSVGTCEWK